MRSFLRHSLAALVLLLVGLAACSTTAPSTPAPTPTAAATRTAGADPVIAAAGDIACDPANGSYNEGEGTDRACRQQATSDLLLSMNPTGVLALGDNQYEDGTLAKFQQSYDRSWGRLKAITYPSVGNHEYKRGRADGYYRYFGGAAGDPAKGYYSFDLGGWHLIALNSECAAVGGCEAGSAQERWLRADLAAHAGSCVLAYWHNPRFSSSAYGNDATYTAFWQALHDAGAAVVLNGHAHSYERFAPQDPSGAADPRGIRQFVVGTGGRNLTGFSAIQPNSEVRDSDTFGVLKLTLAEGAYAWEFVPEVGKTFTDSGSGACPGATASTPRATATPPPAVPPAPPAAGGLTIGAPLQLDRTTVAVGETITGTVTYRNTGTTAMTINGVVIAARPPGGTNPGGPWLDFSPDTGPVTVPPGGTVRLTASRTLAATDPPGAWYSFSTYQDSAGAWHDAPASGNVPFTVTGPPALTGKGTYYVSPSGSDAQPGTLDAPLATIQAGLDRLGPGDTLVLRGGAYYPPSRLRIARSGVGGRPIAIRNYPGESPIIDGQDRLDPILAVDRRAWIIIDGLTLQNAGGARGNGLALTNTTDTQLANITVRQAPQAGIFLGDTTERITILNCDVSGAATGVQIHGRNVLVDGCESHDNGRMVNDGFDCDSDPQTGGDHGGQAFAVNETAGPVEIRNSAGWHNKAPSICYGTDGAFVELYRSQNVNIHHNRSWGGVVTVETAGDTRGVRVWRNEVWDELFLTAHQANDMTIANNTIWNTKHDNGDMVWIGDGDDFGSGSTARFVFVNNILATPGTFFDLAAGGWDPTATVDHNLYYPVAGGGPPMRAGGTAYDIFPAWQAATGREANSVSGDPVVVDPAAHNFRLQPGSPAIDRGAMVAGVSELYVGEASDIGRWEYRTPLP